MSGFIVILVIMGVIVVTAGIDQASTKHNGVGVFAGKVSVRTRLDRAVSAVKADWLSQFQH